MNSENVNDIMRRLKTTSENVQRLTTTEDSVVALWCETVFRYFGRWGGGAKIKANDPLGP